MGIPCKKFPNKAGGYHGVEIGENLGTGFGVYAGKVDHVLKFKSLKGGAHISLSSSASDITISGEPGILVGTSFPATPLIGQHFYRTDVGRTYIWNGTNWQNLGPGSTWSSTASPMMPDTGQLFFNEGTSELLIWNGSAWDEIHLLSNAQLIELNDVQSDYGIAGQYLRSNGTAAVWDDISISRLVDVDLSGLDNGDHLRWNSVSGQWEVRASTLVNLLDTPSVMGGLGQILVSNGTSLEWQGPISPSNGQLLQYNDTLEEWEAVNSEDVGPQVLDDLNDVNSPLPNVNDLLQFNGTEWVPVAYPTFSAGSANVGDTLIFNGTDFEASPGRRLFTNDTPIYVNATTGNDSNDGFTPATAFATLQRALDLVIDEWDLAGWTVTINVADGTYNQDLQFRPLIGAGRLEMIGNQATPSNVVLNGSVSVEGSSPGDYILRGMRISKPSGDAIAVFNHGKLQISDIDFSLSGNHMHVYNNGILEIIGSYDLTGNADNHYYVLDHGLIKGDNFTVTIPNAVTVNDATANAERLAVLNVTNVNYNITTGSVTGRRYDVVKGAVIDTNSGNPNYFPGDVGGVSSTNGLYL